jgi:hypothetical protein
MSKCRDIIDVARSLGIFSDVMPSDIADEYIDEKAPNTKLPNEKKIVANILKTKIDQEYKEGDAPKMIANEIANMAWEIESSEAGSRKTIGDMEIKNAGMYNVHYVGNKSTFPKYLQDIFKNSGSTAVFFSTIRGGKSKHWENIVLHAIGRLEHGYQNMHGFDEPNKDFIMLIKANRNPDTNVPF